MKENLRLGFILLTITGVVALFLGAAHNITKTPIANQIEKANNEAMKEILPIGETFKKLDTKFEENSVIKEINKATKGSNTVGYAIKVAPKGYSGPIEMMVGISAEGKVTGIKILSHSETPGLGANAEHESFSGQYKNKPIDKLLEVVKQKPSKETEIQSITGSTITTKAITLGVNEAVNYYNSKLKGGI